MVASKYDLQRIRLYKMTSKPDYKPLIDEVAHLYQSGKVIKKGTKSGIARAIQIAERLGAGRQATRCRVEATGRGEARGKKHKTWTKNQDLFCKREG